MSEKNTDEGRAMGPKSWVTGWHWRERILHFTPSWFTICMGTGGIQLALVNFPYPYTGAVYWMRNLGYCFWIVEISTFVIFAVMLTIRYIWHPKLFMKSVLEFPACSYFGAIPIAIDTSLVGIISYYGYRDGAVWVAFAFYWVAVATTILCTFGLLIVQIMKQKQHSMEEVAGVWLMTAVPMVITANAGANILGNLDRVSTKAAVTVLIVSFMLWSLGLCLVHLILACYFWRLISYKLPQNQLLASGFLPLAPLAQGALSAQLMCIYLSNYLKKDHYAPTQSHPPPLPQSTLNSTGEAIHWLGILISLFLLAHATFWLVQASAAILYRLPLSFNIGMWSFTFPWASYATAWAILSRDLRNDGMRGWTAFNTVAVILIWLYCAVETVYYGFWKGSLFFAPGLEEWVGDEDDEESKNKKQESQKGGRTMKSNGTYDFRRPSAQDEENGSKVNGQASASGNSNGSEAGEMTQRKSE
ncbi:hypothetical protein LTS18_006063 [Coniosporium uncinatum]|uniref:Uncharacterized protein n=1 Tax=Coniosporium uncinatum TaxID=93489 RepID=A0ACC3DXT9_9PEZI|nr:hypothetical protein LTS18_006063 [Coniosporium uncinatum]